MTAGVAQALTLSDRTALQECEPAPPCTRPRVRTTGPELHRTCEPRRGQQDPEEGKQDGD